MSDVVWAINPKRDTLRDTIRRMRQHAEDVFAGRGVRRWSFMHPRAIEQRRVPIDVRRDFFLIFKEALNNAVRHSELPEAERLTSTSTSRVCISALTDDGVGFDTSAEAAGNGADEHAAAGRAAWTPRWTVVSAAGSRNHRVSCRCAVQRDGAVFATLHECVGDGCPRPPVTLGASTPASTPFASGSSKTSWKSAKV